MRELKIKVKSEIKIETKINEPFWVFLLTFLHSFLVSWPFELAGSKSCSVDSVLVQSCLLLVSTIVTSEIIKFSLMCNLQFFQ